MDNVVHNYPVSMKVVFFDFDGTITKHDTFIEFAKFSIGRNSLYFAILKNFKHLIMWKLGLTTNSQTKERLFSTLFKGKRYDWFKECGIRFKEKIEKDLNSQTIQSLRSHKLKGHKVVIVSASIPEWIVPWASENGVDLVIGTEIELNDNGIITGKFLSPNCHGKEKVNRIKAKFPNIEKYETWGYGDSDGDNKMLEMVDHPTRLK